MSINTFKERTVVDDNLRLHFIGLGVDTPRYMNPSHIVAIIRSRIEKSWGNAFDEIAIVASEAMLGESND